MSAPAPGRRRLVLIESAALILAALVLAFVLGRLAFDMVEKRRIANTGSPAQARVISITHAGARFNDHLWAELKLEVAPVGDLSYTASVRLLVNVLDLPRYQPGQTIAVKVDPADPKRVALANPG